MCKGANCVSVWCDHRKQELKKKKQKQLKTDLQEHFISSFSPVTTSRVRFLKNFKISDDASPPPPPSRDRRTVRRALCCCCCLGVCACVCRRQIETKHVMSLGGQTEGISSSRQWPAQYRGGKEEREREGSNTITTTKTHLTDARGEAY